MPHTSLGKIRDIRIPVAIVSLCLSLWASALDDVINSDGVLYVLSAEEFHSGDWHAGYSLYKWPFYPVSSLINCT
jgi:hypothetical protein